MDRRLLAHTSSVLRDTATLLSGGAVTPLVDELDQLHDLVRDSSERIADFCRSSAATESAVHLSFRSRLLAGAVRNAAADALVVTRRADRQAVAAERARWQGRSSERREGRASAPNDHAGRSHQAASRVPQSRHRHRRQFLRRQ